MVGLPIALLGALLAAVPSHILPVCETPHGAAPMRCHWTGMMMIGFGLTFFLVGALLFFCRTNGVRTGLSAAALLLTATAGTVPDFLIGMCAAPAMACRTGTYPGVMAVLALTAAACAANLVYLRHLATRERHGDETSHHRSHRAEQS
jgi:hypothetical protein